MNIEDFSLVILEGLDEVFSHLRKKVLENRHLIEEVNADESGQIKIKAIPFENFYFSINSAEEQKQNIIVFKYTKSPWADTVKKGNDGQGEKKTITEQFDKWIELVERYNKLNFDDPIINKYQEEIFEYLKIFDDDANEEPFAIEQQVLLAKYLGDIESITKEETNEYEEIILKEIKEAKVIVTRVPKNTLMRKISRILAVARKSNLKLFKDFLDVFKKEMMKKTLWQGIDKIEELFGILVKMIE